MTHSPKGAGIITVWRWCVFYCVEPFGSQATRPSPPRSTTWAHTSWMTTPWRCGLSERSSRTTTATSCFLHWALVPSFPQTDESRTSLPWWGDDLLVSSKHPAIHPSIHTHKEDCQFLQGLHHVKCGRIDLQHKNMLLYGTKQKGGTVLPVLKMLKAFLDLFPGKHECLVQVSWQSIK